jgi:hypothetical protein
MENCCSFWPSVKNLDTNLAETQCIPKSSVKIVCHEPLDIPASFAASWALSQRFPWITFFTWAIRGSNLEVEGWPDHSPSSIEVLHATCFVFLLLFSYFETGFNTNSLLLY